jgi:acyl dehydratase
VNSRLRATAVLTSVDEVPGGVQIVLTVTVEAEGEAKPVCVAETVSRIYA